MESESWAAWADLPPELLAIISDCLEEVPDITCFRGVCRSWRSSVIPIPNKISPLFPRSLPSSCLDLLFRQIKSFPVQCKSRPKLLIANAVYLVRSKKAASAAFMISVQESEAGKLLLRNALTYEPFASGYSLDLWSSSGWSLTRIAISHSFQFTPKGNFLCPCTVASRKKVVVVPHPSDSSCIALFDCIGMSALGRCLSTDVASASQLVVASIRVVRDYVNFNGRLHVVDNATRVFLLDHTGSQLLLLTCVNFNVFGWSKFTPKRFVVSDGDLYLVFNLCEQRRNHEFHIYKLVMDDLNNATCYRLEKVENLGDRVFIINRDCSFSVTAQDLLLPPPLVGNCIIVAKSAFSKCDCFSEFYVYHLGGQPAERVPQHAYSTLFKPPSSWFNDKESKGKE